MVAGETDTPSSENQFIGKRELSTQLDIAPGRIGVGIRRSPARYNAEQRCAYCGRYYNRGKHHERH